jgi:hypothetical protein
VAEGVTVGRLVRVGLGVTAEVGQRVRVGVLVTLDAALTGGGVTVSIILEDVTVVAVRVEKGLAGGVRVSDRLSRVAVGLVVTRDGLQDTSTNKHNIHRPIVLNIE